MFNLAATALTRETLLRSEFTPMRHALRLRDDQPIVGHDYVNVFPEHPSIGDFDHVLSIVCSPRHHKVIGFASLFGGLRFSAVLADNIDLPPVTAVLVQDPIERTHRKERAETVGDLPFTPQSAGSLADDVEASAKGIRAAFARVLDASYKGTPSRCSRSGGRA